MAKDIKDFQNNLKLTILHKICKKKIKNVKILTKYFLHHFYHISKRTNI